MFEDALLNVKSAPIADDESYNLTPRSFERKTSSPYGSNPVWSRRQTDISIENKLTIIDTMKPFVITGRYLGLVESRSRIASVSLYLFLSIIVMAIIRTSMSLYYNTKSFDGTFIIVLLMFIHYFKCICSLYYLRRLLGPASSNFYGLWEDVVEGINGSPESKIHIKKWVAFGYFFVVFGSIISAICVTLGSMKFGFELPGIESILVYPRIISMNGLFMLAASYFDFMLQAMYTVLCMAIYFEFNHLLKKLSKITIRDPQDMEYQVKNFRLNHYQLIDLTDQLDALISYYAFVIITVNLPILCALWFVLGNVTNSFGTTLSMGFWVAKLLSEILIVTLPPSTISYVAVQSLYPVYEISNKLRVDKKLIADADEEFMSEEVNDNDWLTKQGFQQTFLFVQQLTKRQIGISCGGFFIITKESLLTIISVMITYFVVILQLDLSAQFHCECVCNNTMTN